MANSSVQVTCQSFPEHPEQCDAINIVRRVIGAVSCIGCLFVIFVIWVFGRYAVFTQRLILYLSLAALLNGFGRLIQENTGENGPWCVFQAFWLHYFNYAVMLWVCCITFNLFMNVIRNIDVIVTKSYEKWYHAVSWLLSLAMSLIPFIGNHYGPSGSWCWIISDSGWRMGTWYVPLFLVIIGLIIVYSYIVFTLSRQASTWERTYDPDTRRAQEALREDIKPLRLYPFVFLVLSLFPLINRIQNAVADEHVFGLVLMHCISASLQGAAYSLVFAIDRQTLRSLTPANIKLALQKKKEKPVIAQEYTMAEVVVPTPQGETGSVTAHAQQGESQTPAETSSQPQANQASGAVQGTGDQAQKV